ncbi:MAG: hypothetical protein JNN22_05305 [Rhodospirillales bacterium]|nr:hypothetical protein [Rhodospirillales bacterium]
MAMNLKMPSETKPFVWGAVVGAVATMIVGFGFGGWVTGGTSTRRTADASNAAIVAALAPICVNRFKMQDNAAAKLADLAKVSSWERGSVIEKTGFATMVGNEPRNGDVARACAEILSQS